MTSTKTEKQLIGKKGEDIAVNFLLENDYEIIARNYRYKRSEIDIICKKNAFLVFIEVKTRKNNIFGFPEEQISQNQIRNIQNAAIHFQNNTTISYSLVRYDVISILINNNISNVTHLEDTF